MAYLGWIASAIVCIFLVCKTERVKHESLQTRIAGLGSLLGKEYETIALTVGAPPLSIEHRGAGQTIRTWQEGRYSISLLFDCSDFCLGVMDERF